MDNTLLNRMKEAIIKAEDNFILDKLLESPDGTYIQDIPYGRILYTLHLDYLEERLKLGL